MRLLVLLFFCSTCLNAVPNDYSGPAVTFTLNGGRFGDCIKNYVTSKWIAYKYQLPFYLMPFNHADVLMAYNVETLYTPEIEKRYNHKIMVNAEYNIKAKMDPYLFITHYYTKLYFPQKKLGLFEEIVTNNEFGQQIKFLLQPCVPVKILELPKDKITVAVHVRKGTPNDGKLLSPQLYQSHQGNISYSYYHISRSCKQTHSSKVYYADAGGHGIKFPPEQFYIDQIKKLSELVGNKPLYLYLFTDDPNPRQLIDRFQKAIQLPNIMYAAKDEHSYEDTFVDDYYNMAQFDCLIRPDSSFSYASQLLGNHSIIIYPQSGRWVDDKLIMQNVVVVQVDR